MPPHRPFARDVALVIGIDRYAHVPCLRSAVNDVREIGDCLRQLHGFEVITLLDEEASGGALRARLSQLRAEITEHDRLLLYFAGHGMVLDSSEPGDLSLDAGPQGYLVPQDATLDDARSLLPMLELYAALSGLPCRHLLLVLDCCFAGAIHWASRRNLRRPRSAVLFAERFARYVRETAWQVLASASDDEQALDVLRMFGARAGDADAHSPFAAAFLSALRGDADVNRDGVTLATEIYLYIESQLADLEQQRSAQQQRPSLQALRVRTQGEFFFFTPNCEMNLPSAMKLDAEHNPYRGLQAYRKEHRELYFGRERLVQKLTLRVESAWFVVVLGLSGTGKSSLVQAGLLPRIERTGETGWRILGPLRPSRSPLRSLYDALMQSGVPLRPELRDAPSRSELLAALRSWAAGGRREQNLLVLDQMEELVTLCADEAERDAMLQLLDVLIVERFLHVVATLRLDFEPQMMSRSLARHWQDARFLVPPPEQDDLRQIIEGPAELRVLHFEPPEFVDQLINEVVHVPGALPLLSFTLSELYLYRLADGPSKRSLTLEHYHKLGGVIGALQHRINTIYDELAVETPPDSREPSRACMRQILLRMVATDSGERARRRVPRAEYDYGTSVDNARIDHLLGLLLDARLIVSGSEAGEAFVEPAHDALINGWTQLSEWVAAERKLDNGLAFQRRLTQAAREWAQGGDLWDRDGRLELAVALVKRAPELCNSIERRFVRRSVERKRRSRQITIGVTLGIVASLTALTVWALSSSSEANKQRINAQLNEGKATTNAKKAEEQAVLAKKNEIKAEEQAVLAKKNEIKAEEQAKAAKKNENEAKRQTQIAEEQTRQARREATYARDQIRMRRANDRMVQDPTLAVLLLASVEDPLRIQGEWTAQARTALGYPIYLSVIGDIDERGAVSDGQHRPALLSARLSPDGKLIATGAEDGRVRLAAADGTGRPHALSCPENDSAVRDVVFSPDGRQLAASTRSGHVLLFQVGASPAETRPCIRQPVHEKTILNMGYSADGSLLLTGSSDGTAAVWPVRAQRPPTLLRGHGSEVFAVAITPDGQQVITGTGAGRIERFRVSDGALMFSESVGTSAVSAIAIPNGESAPPLCAAALWDGRTILFSHGEKPMHQMSLHSGRSRTQSVAWRRVDEKKHWAVLSVSAEGRVLQSELSLPDETHPPVVSPEQLLVEAGTPTRWAEFSSDGGHLVLLHVDGGATVHALRGSSKVGLPLLGHQSSIATVHFDSAGTHVITAARDGTARRIKLPPQDVAQLNPVQLQKALAEVRGVCLPIEDRQNVDRQEATKEYWQCMHKRGQTDLAIAGPAAARAPNEDGIKRPKAARRRKADSG